MESTTTRRFDTLVNVATILAAVAMILFLGNDWVKRTSQPQASISGDLLVAGDVVKIPGVDWSGSDKNVVLVLRKDCRYCTESLPFYKSLLQQSQHSSAIRVFVALPASSIGYSEKWGLQSLVREVSTGNLQISGTPTMMIVDKQGKIARSWLGKLTSSQEREVMQILGL